MIKKFILVFVIAFSSAEDIVKEMLTESYDPAKNPLSLDKGQLAEVNVSVYCSSISAIDEKLQEMTVNLLLGLEWYDERLNYPWKTDYKDLPYDILNYVWHPGIIFTNAKNGMNYHIKDPNMFARLYKIKRKFSFLARYSVTLLCDFDLHNYPFDIQHCPIKVESYTENDKELELKISEERVMCNPKTVAGEGKFAIYKVTLNHTFTNYGTDPYPCVVVDLELRRFYGFHLVKTFAIITMVDLLSWTSFWLDVETAVGARTTLGITTFLVMITIFGQSSQLPFSYMKAVDVWIYFSIFMVFAAMMELAVANYLFRKRKHRKNDSEDADESKSQSKFLPSLLLQNKLINKLSEHVTGDTAAHTVDRLSRIIFPLVFVIFNLVYWSVYLEERLKSD